MTEASDQSDADYVHELESGEEPSEAVYSVIAAVSNCPPTDLEPLANRVNPDALDALFGRRAATADAHVRFDCCGYEVTVTPEAVSIKEEDEDC